MSNPIIWQPEDYILFRKCGEICISPDANCLGFNCLFCSSTCLQVDIFLLHLQTSHKDDIFRMYQVQNATLSSELVHLPNNVNMVLEPNTVLNNNVVTLTSGLNVLYGLNNSTITTASPLWPKAEMENLVQINPLEHLKTATIYTATNAEFSPTCSSSSSPSSDTSCNTYSDSECEIADGEDTSGLVLVQTPRSSECDGHGGDDVGGGVSSGFSDCMSLNEDSKSMNNFPDKSNPMENEENADLRSTNRDQCLESTKTKSKYIKTAAMRKALDCREITTYLLELYRQNEKLWNPEHVSYRYNARRSVYKELSKPLFQATNVNLSGVEIFGVLNILRGRYRRELAKFHSRKGKHRTHLWYFEKMDFLRKVIEDKRMGRLKERARSLEISTRDSGNATNRQILSFIIGEYKKKPCLWNPKDEEYVCCNASEIYDEMAVHLHEELNIVLTEKEIQNEIQKLRIRYRKELRILYKLKGLYIPKLWCFDEMEFLRPVMEAKVLKNLKTSQQSTTQQNKNGLDQIEEIEFPGLEQQLQFIDIYQNYSSLWDVDHPDYRSANYRNKALESMLDDVNTSLQNMNISVEQLEKTLNQLRKDFSTEKLKRLQDKDSDRAVEDPSTAMSLIIYEKLAVFLAMNLGPFRCEDCRHICKTYDNYKIHKSKHDGTLPFICTLCGKGFQMPGNLTIHIRRHRRDYPYSCEICNKSFATSTEVNIHMRSHTGERPYICNLCGKTFKTWSFFDIHKRTHLKQSNFHCPICDKSFYERNRFTDHMNVHLNIRKHRCEQCGKGFTTIANLKKHMELHAPTKKYKCTSCNKCFAQSASLSWHKKAQHEN